MIYTLQTIIYCQKIVHIFFFCIICVNNARVKFSYFLDEICYSFGHKTIFKKTEKDFQGRVIKKPAPTNTLLRAGDPTTRPC